MRIRPLIAALCCAPTLLWAQIAVPYYHSEDALAGLYAGHSAPRARAFAERAPELVAALQAHCSGPGALAPARQAWTQTMLAWERLAAVAVGPLVERRSLREIDFQPLRPELLKRMLAREPKTPEDFERVGTPAKGLPAIEHLLWTAPAAPRTPACGYAVLAAQAVQREAEALRSAFDALAATPPEEEDAVAPFVEFVNQWLGGLERLRWASLEKPLREAATRGGAPAFTREASGQTGAAWAADWAELRALARQPDAGAPPIATAPGTQAPISIESYLRGRGHLALADRWHNAVDAADRAMQGLNPARPASVEATARALKGLTALMQAEVAAGMEVSLGFSSADGD
ncbi:imelysin family protein [Hydrogenophaga crocea]|uniref:Imelysin family protein n=1 Tax=Hydrogenophaga crocea TaxID=2716225 RepID=A0A6G8IJ87_9BURK|nr:imelysin family protein [Hydrogenophaga crocea]QIM53302.1 imelysin family protein [Hydrogenophaga crocea]